MRPDWCHYSVTYLTYHPSTAWLAAPSSQRTSLTGSSSTSLPTSTSVRLQPTRSTGLHTYSLRHSDVSVSGSKWNAAGSPSLAHLIKGAALDIPHPTEPSKTLWDARQDQGPYLGQTDAEVTERWVQQNKDYVLDDLSIPPLGSGSDFTPFLQHLGVSDSFSMFDREGRSMYLRVTDCQHGPGLWRDSIRRAVPLPLHLRLTTVAGSIR